MGSIITIRYCINIDLSRNRYLNFIVPAAGFDFIAKILYPGQRLTQRDGKWGLSLAPLNYAITENVINSFSTVITNNLTRYYYICTSLFFSNYNYLDTSVIPYVKT